VTTLTTPQAPPRLTYALSAAWVPLQIPRTEAETAAAAEALAAAYPDLAGAQAGVARLLGGVARACAALNVLGAHAAVAATAAGPRPVTLVVSASPRGPEPLAGLVRDLAGAGTGPLVQTTSLAAGPAVRAEWSSAGNGETLDRLVVQYLVEIADGRALGTLTFAAPAAGAAGELRPLFHQIAASVRCDPPGRPAGRAGYPARP
jgi:hypothetical protein